MRLLSFLRVRVALLAALAAFAVPSVRSQTSTPSIEIDANAAPHPFPHFWEKMFGSGRAILSLRESYLHDLRETKRITDEGREYFHEQFAAMGVRFIPGVANFVMLNVGDGEVLVVGGAGQDRR